MRYAESTSDRAHAEDPPGARLVALSCPTWEHFDRLYREKILRGAIVLPLDAVGSARGSVTVRVSLPSGDTLDFLADASPAARSQASHPPVAMTVRFAELTVDQRRQTVARVDQLRRGGAADSKPRPATPDSGWRRATRQQSSRAPASERGAAAAGAARMSDPPPAGPGRRPRSSRRPSPSTVRERASSDNAPDDSKTLARLRGVLGDLQDAPPAMLLGVSEQANKDELRQAYLAKSRVFHPDRFANSSPEAQETAERIFILISDAHRKLLAGAVTRCATADVAPPSNAKEAAPPSASADAAPASIARTVTPVSVTADAPTHAPRSEPAVSSSPASRNEDPAAESAAERRRRELRAELARKVREAKERGQAQAQAQRGAEGATPASAGPRSVRHPQIIAAADPEERIQQVKVLVAQARRLKDVGLIQEYERTLRRILSIAPGNEWARGALKNLVSPDDDPPRSGGGLLSRLFGKAR